MRQKRRLCHEPRITRILTDVRMKIFHFLACITYDLEAPQLKRLIWVNQKTRPLHHCSTPPCRHYPVPEKNQTFIYKTNTILCTSLTASCTELAKSGEQKKKKFDRSYYLLIRKKTSRGRDPECELLNIGAVSVPDGIVRAKMFKKNCR